MAKRQMISVTLMTALLFSAQMYAPARAQGLENDVPAQQEQAVRPAAKRNYVVEMDKLRVDAEKGNPRAQTDMGLLYLSDAREAKNTRKEGQLGTLEQDYGAAMKWYRKAADQGYAAAQYRIGLMFQMGEGVKQDYAEEMKWSQKAAAQGYAAAQASLGDAYFNGRGVAQSYEEALKWLQKAADQGDANALLQMGWMYRDGKSVKKDYVQAYLWIGLAVEKAYNNDTLIEERDEVGAKLTPEQLAEARDLAAKWKKTHTLTITNDWLAPAKGQ